MHGRDRHPAADHMHQPQGLAGHCTAAAPACAAEPATDAAAKAELNVLLCQLRDRDDQQQTLQAARVIGQFAMQGPDHQAAAAAAGAISVLVDLLRSSTNEQLQGYCALALGKLALRNPAIQEAVADSGATTLLVDLVARSSSDETRGCTALALASLAWHNSSISASIVAAGAIDHITQLFDSTETSEVHGHAAQALGSLAAAHPAAALNIITAGGITCLTRLLGSQCSSMAAKTEALRALRNLVTLIAFSSHTAAATEDIVPAVVQLALDHSRNNESNSSRTSRSQNNTGHCIQQVAEDVLQLLVQLSAAHALAAILRDGSACMPALLGSSGSSTMRKHAALGIAQAVAWHPQKALPLMQAGVIPPLVQLLSDADAGVQEAAAAAVGTLASSDVHVQAALVDASVITPLVDVLRKRLCHVHSSTTDVAPSIALLDWAAYAIAHICRVSQEAQTSIYKAGAVQLLVDLLHVPGAQHTAAYALGNLCANNADAQEAAVAAGLAALLVQLLGEQHPPAVQKAAAAALGNIAAGNAEVSSVLAAEGAVTQLILLLEAYTNNSSDIDSSSSSSNIRLDVVDWAVYALGHLIKWSPDAQETVSVSNAVMLLIGLLGADATAAVQQNAACALANLAAGQGKVQEQIADAGGVAALVQLLDSRHCFAVRSSAAAALWELVKHSPRNSLLLAAAGGINPFVKVLACEERTAEKLKVHEWAGHVLQQLTDSSCQQVQADMFAAGAILPLQELAKEPPLLESTGSLPLVNSNSGNCDHVEQQQRQQKGELLDVGRRGGTECTALQHNQKQQLLRLRRRDASRWRFAGATSRLTHRHDEQQHDLRPSCDLEGAELPATPDIVLSRSKRATHKDQRSCQQHQTRATGNVIGSTSSQQQQQQQCNKAPATSAGIMPEHVWWRPWKTKSAASASDIAVRDDDVRRSADLPDV